MKNSKSFITILVLSLCIVVLTIFRGQIGQYTSYIISKIEYGTELQFNELYIDLPDRWWIVDNNSNQVTLSKLHSNDMTDSFFVFIEKRNISDNVVNYFGQHKNFGDGINASRTQFKRNNINGTNFYLFSYIVENSAPYNDNIYLFWTAPNINITISATNISPIFEKDFYNLVENIQINVN